jgi:hypothetical protein
METHFNPEYFDILTEYGKYYYVPGTNVPLLQGGFTRNDNHYHVLETEINPLVVLLIYHYKIGQESALQKLHDQVVSTLTKFTIHKPIIPLAEIPKKRNKDKDEINFPITISVHNVGSSLSSYVKKVGEYNELYSLDKFVHHVTTSSH